MKYILFVLLILSFSSCGIDKEGSRVLTSTNNSGELDTTFNSSGFLVLNGSAGGSGNDVINALTVDNQGRIIAVGSSTNVGGDTDMAVWRLTSNGNLDSSFANNGVFIHDGAAGGSGNDAAYAVTVNSANEIFVTGTSLSLTNFDMVVWKLTAGGSLDNSFDTDGIFVGVDAAGFPQHDQGNGIVLDSSGNIIVAGFSDQSLFDRDLAVWKIDASGNPDNSFDTDGIQTLDSAALAGGEDDVGEALVIDAADNIIIAGYSESATSRDMALWKLSTNGALDASFDSDGFFSHNSAAGGNGIDSATDITLDAEGNIYVSGFSRNSSNNFDMTLWKLNSSGSFVTSFDSDGILVFDASDILGVSGSSDAANSLRFDPQDNLLVTGTGNEDMCVWRFTSDGVADTNFNTDGFFCHDSAAGGFDADSGLSILGDSLNRIYIGGSSQNASGDFDATFWRMK